MDYNIKQDESLRDYKIRLCRNKEIYDISFKEIASLLNAVSDSTTDESTIRRWWNGYREGYEDAQREELNSDAILAEYETKRIEAEKAVVRYRDQRNEYNRLIRESARNDIVYDLLVESLNNVEPIQIQTMPIRNPDDRDLIVCLDDIHFGANIKNFWNIYSSDVAKQRMSLYLKEVEQIAREHNAMNCYVLNAGDSISGGIHGSIRLTNKENLIEQVMGVSELISWFLVQLSGIFKNVNYAQVSGNHGRLEPNKSDSVRAENFEILIPWYIKARVQNYPNITILQNDIDESVNIVNIRNKNYLTVHGDYDNFDRVDKIIHMVGGSVYGVHMGHLHHNKTESISGYKVFRSGSYQGVDDFCIQKRIYGVAEQLVAVVDVHGIVCYYDVPLQ